MEGSYDNDLIQALLDNTEPDRQFLRRLVRNPANLSATSIHGESALYIAVKKNFMDSVRILLDAGASPNIKLQWSQETPLHFCSSVKQSTDMVRELLKHGADVGAEDWLKRTPLHNATYHQCVENMLELLQNGAKVDVVDAHGQTPLICAMDFSANVSTIQVLLHGGADLNLRHEDGEAPLHYAVEKHLPHVVRLFLRHDADANIRDDLGNTPLHRTAFSSLPMTELIRDLRKGGARLNELNNDGHSPLYCAIDYQNEETALEMLRSGSLFDVVECLEALLCPVYRRWPFHKITEIAHEIIRYVFINSSDSLESIRNQLMQKRVVSILENISSPECNLKKFKHGCLSEVDTLSKMNCDCGKSSIWGSLSGHTTCNCDNHQAILKFLFSERTTNFTHAFFNRLSKEFLLEVTLNLMSYFEFKESKIRVMLNEDCMKEIERHLSFEDIVSFLQGKQSDMGPFEFEKFQAYMKGESVKSSREINPQQPKET